MRYGPQHYDGVYIVGTGSFLPGEPVDNEAMDRYISPLDPGSVRLKRRVLADNGITTRHYGIDPEGEARYTAAQMGALAVESGLAHAGVKLSDITFLAAATSGGDVLMPGFANMLQGELRGPPMSTRSHHGICGAGIGALTDAANHVGTGNHTRAVVAAVEFPSRLLRKSRYTSLIGRPTFDAEFLRWMLSDGAGACVLSSHSEAASGTALRVDWIHTKSFSGDYPPCMQLGTATEASKRSFMDYESFASAERAGALLLRQDLRILPQLFEVAVHEYAELVRAGHVIPEKVTHFLAHYSSEKLGKVCDELMRTAGLHIQRERWFSNLTRRGNTGSSAIFIQLADLMRERSLLPGERVLCFVPESGRFSVSFVMLTVVPGSGKGSPKRGGSAHAPVAPPHDPGGSTKGLIKDTLQGLASIWHEYRSGIWHTPFVAKILGGKLTRQDYLRWMETWIPQVQEGTRWMRQAVADLPDAYADLRDLIHQHADDEHGDFMMLFQDYRRAGGTIASVNDLRRNAGGEALNAYMHGLAREPLPVGLLGGVYIIEGTGQRIIPALLPSIRQQLALPEECYRFLRYHGENDPSHLARWLNAVELVLATPNENAREHAHSIMTTAKHVAALYTLQWELL
ncbi:iron-containing redox enzyme family protein [Ectothiorhodospiraceae bacterium 2226]|nr:iron-containing redox enzyme family protein [Ectothiorhodospiraceae bacterium 2226]